MSHWAEIDSNNIVLRVLVGDNNEADEGEAFMKSLGGTWVKTSYNAATNGFRKNYAGIGYSYDTGRNAFIPPKPECHPDAIIFDEQTCTWSCPDATHVLIQGEE
jgi:hypothetical protein